MEYVKLTELCENYDSKRKPITSSDRINGYIPYYGASGIVDYVKDYIFDENLLLISEDGANLLARSTPIAFSISGKTWVNNHAHVLKFDNLSTQKYVEYYVNNIDISQFITGSAQPKLNQKMLNELLIPKIPLDLQTRIVQILDTVKALINKRRQQIEACDELMKSKFIEMFGDPIENPMRWKVEKLKKLSTKIMSGNTPKGGNQVYVEDGIMFFRSQNVWKNKLELTDIAFIDEETHRKMGKSSLKNRDILMTKTGRINTENSSLGRAAMYLGEDDCANINGHVYLIRLKKNVINEFVLFILTTDEYREHIRRVCVGGIDKRQINKEHLEEFPIILPPIDLQSEFISIIKKVNDLKSTFEKSLAECNDCFNALLNNYFGDDKDGEL